MNRRSELLNLAAEMALGQGLPSEVAEDHAFSKATPLKDRRRVVAEAQTAREAARQWAARVRQVADALATETSEETLKAVEPVKVDALQVEDRLCWYDGRNPNSTVADYLADFGELPPAPRSPGCSCDNCFYGRDRLAVEILRLRDEAKKLRRTWVEDDGN